MSTSDYCGFWTLPFSSTSSFIGCFSPCGTARSGQRRSLAFLVAGRKKTVVFVPTVFGRQNALNDFFVSLPLTELSNCLIAVLQLSAQYRAISMFWKSGSRVSSGLNRQMGQHTSDRRFEDIFPDSFLQQNIFSTKTFDFFFDTIFPRKKKSTNLLSRIFLWLFSFENNFFRRHHDTFTLYFKFARQVHSWLVVVLD